MKKSLITLLITGCFSWPVFAADQVAKEDTTPPPAEGPLTLDQIQPINSLPLANTPPPTPQKPATPTTSPSTEPPKLTQ